MRSNHPKSGDTFSPNPWKVTHRVTFTPIAASFASPTQIPGRPGARSATIP